MEPTRRYRVPDELREVLLDFTIAYLLERPPNVAQFGLNFFQRLAGVPTTGGRGSVQGGRASGSEQPRGGGIQFHHTDEHIPGRRESQMSPVESPSVAAIPRSAKRKSVFAEAYNPEEDKDETAVVYPKTDAERKTLAEAVKHILLFRSLEAEQLGQVLDAMFERLVQTNEFVIKQGDDGDNFYVIESGKYKAYVQGPTDPEPKLVGNYDGKGSFGELALMYNVPRAASVQAETEGRLWAMDRQTFRRIVLKSAYHKRQMYEHLLESVPMLQELQNYERMNLADALTPRTFKAGATIIKQGDVADGMYFVEEGEVRVSRFDKEEKEITRLKQGGYFGELALITKKPRAATVTAVSDVKVAFLDVGAFERLLGPCMEIMKRNVANYEQQLTDLFGSPSGATDLREATK